MYRFLLTPRWLGGLALVVAAAIAMVFLGVWQWHRYEERSAINHRIDAADSVQAVPLGSVLAPPATPARSGPGGSTDASWTKVTVTGRYDPAHEIQVRGRTVGGDVGFEIVTPLVLGDGAAVLVDRGWIPPAGDALAAPHVPPAPDGQVTVVGQVHLSESRPTPVAHRDGRLDTRRISVPRLAREMPYPVYGAYVLVTAQTPKADPAFVPIPIDHEDAWQNAGYTVQWWLFAAMALFAYGWLARKEAQESGGSARSSAASSVADAGASMSATVADRANAPAGAAAAPGDRPVESRAAGSSRTASHAEAPGESRAARASRAESKPGAVGESDRSRPTRAEREEPLDRVAEWDRKAAERNARKARRPR